MKMSCVLNWTAAVVITLAVSFSGQAVAAPSFDCNKASTRVERMICDHPRIARLDSEMADAYRTALRDSPWASANWRIRAEQKQWIAERNRCRKPRCLRQLYRQRIDQLHAEVDGGNAGGGSSAGGSGIMQVTGVAANDVLNVRSGAGTNFRIVGALGNGDTVRNLGCERQTNSRWCEIEMMTDMRERGWVNARFLTAGSASSGSIDGLSGTPVQFDWMVTPCVAQAARLTGASRGSIRVLDRIRTGGGPILTLSAAGGKYTCRLEANDSVTVFSEYAN